MNERSATPPDLLFVGTRGGIESTVVPRAGLPLAHVVSRPLVRRLSLGTARTLAANALGIAQSLRIVARFGPDCVVATGGYVAFPVVLAARILRTIGLSRARIALLEPNATPGLANRLLAPLVDEMWVDSGSGAGGKTVATGTPVRGSIARFLAPAAARQALGLAPDRTTVVVMGGSQGARRINEAVAQAAAFRAFPDDWQVLLVTGEREAGWQRAQTDRPTGGVTVVPYLDDPAAAYAAADIVVARAGASTIAELAATGTPAILVPYPFATGDHQAHNAERARALGVARIVRDEDLTGARLAAELRAALEGDELESLRNAARRLASIDARTLVCERIAVLAARVKPHGVANEQHP